MVMTGNLRAWRHFFVMRTNRGAEAEIRRLAHPIAEVLFPIAPTVFDDLQRNIVDGYVEFTSS
jgi:thymidylate synthase (FAD)